VLVGASRKGFLREALSHRGDDVDPMGARDDASAALSALAATSRAWAVRVHEVRSTRVAVQVVATLQEHR
jgi:dihydropteroate synthase